ncbi:MAG TPA: hypothetical protein PLN55_12165 [Burkholderiaceae bacterium]|nr:hypothetical protein [Burkholderiaceae bacterium]
MALGHGGERAGAGRPVGGDALNGGPERAKAKVDFEFEKARHERLKADEREFELGIKQGEYLPRESQKVAAATALAILTQSLRSIPDNLERSLGLGPETVEQVAVEIDNALAEVALAFRAMTRE